VQGAPDLVGTEHVTVRPTACYRAIEVRTPAFQFQHGRLHANMATTERASLVRTLGSGTINPATSR
jgi:hypothetical protein